MADTKEGLSDTELLTPSGRASERPSAVRLGSMPATPDDEVRFVQTRMALFAQVTGLISGVLLVAAVLADTASKVPMYPLVSRLSHGTGTLVALAAWRVLATPRRFSPHALQGFDVLGTLAICWSFALLGHTALQPYGYFAGLLAVTHVSILRAMIVPSIPRRTLVLGVLSFGALVLSQVLLPTPVMLAGHTGGSARGAVWALLWCAAGCAVATIASRVIYGLRESVREARQLGQYTLEEEIGRGGMARVYRAHHAMLRRPTALKLLAGAGSEERVRRFEKEVQLTARLTHPNTISIYDYGRTLDGLFYYTMELLGGMNLEQLVSQHGPQHPGRAIHIVRQACGALEEAHHEGLIHRDVKPANIHLCQRGQIADFVKVLDFGLVREISEDHAVSDSRVDAVVGTPLYLAPEAILTPEAVDARVDIYGLGCVLYFLVTARTPFTGKNAVELCAHHLHTAPVPPSTHRPVTPDLEAVILACLAKDPRDRPASARQLSRALELCHDATSWTEADAEAWWAQYSPTAGARVPAPTHSGERLLQSFRPADLSERMARRG